MLAEDAATDEREARLCALPALGDLPLGVLARRLPPEALEAGRIWRELQQELAGRSARERFVPADASGQNIALDQPERVIAAIQAPLGQAAS